MLSRRPSVARAGALRSVRHVLLGMRSVGILSRPTDLPVLLRALRDGSDALPDVLRAAAERWPAATAFADDDGVVGYAALDASADAVAVAVRRALQPAGLRPLGSAPRVGVLCGDDRGFVAAVVGALRAGADVVPLRPASGSMELLGVVERERVRVVVHDEPSAPLAARLGVVRVPLEAAGRASRGAAPADREGRGPLGRVRVLTAGASGGPAEARRSSVARRRRTRLAVHGVLDLRRGEAVLVLPHLFGSHGLGLLTAALTVGAPVVTAGGRSGEELCATALRFETGVIAAAPVHLVALAEHLDTDEHLSARPQVRRVVSGSAPLRPAVVRELVEHLGPTVVDLFGTAATGTVTAATTSDLVRAPACVGRPMAGVVVAVVDDAGVPVLRGAPGRVVVGPSGPAGRVGAAGSARRAWDGDRVVVTHDRGRMDRRGRLTLIGRSDAVVVEAGGANVLPGEVEVLLAVQPGVSDVVVRPAPDRDRGMRLVADVVLVPAGPLHPSEAPRVLARVVRSTLGEHKVPEVRVVDALWTSGR